MDPIHVRKGDQLDLTFTYRLGGDVSLDPSKIKAPDLSPAANKNMELRNGVWVPQSHMVGFTAYMRSYQDLLVSQMNRSFLLASAQQRGALTAMTTVSPEPPAPYEPPVPTRSITGPIVGYRIFYSRDGLRAANFNYTWKPGWNEAVCLRSSKESWFGPSVLPGNHAVPDPQCTCGFYGYSDLGDILEYYTVDDYAEWFIVAGVEYGGRVVLHEDGLRASKARILNLAVLEWKEGELDRDTWTMTPGQFVPRHGCAEEVHTYGVPIFDSPQALRAHTIEHGNELPRMRPDSDFAPNQSSTAEDQP